MEPRKALQQERVELEWPRVKPTIIPRAEVATDNNLTRARAQWVAELLLIARAHKSMQTLKKRTRRTCQKKMKTWMR